MNEPLHPTRVLLLKELAADPLRYDTPGGPESAFLMHLRGTQYDEGELVSLPPVAFLDYEAVVQFATSILEWGAAAFGLGVRTQVIDLTDFAKDKKPAPEGPVKTGQYL